VGSIAGKRAVLSSGLSDAALHGDAVTVKALLAKGAKVNAKDASA
jgi:hypothetical protein